jgi:hypothetical protein
MREGERLEPRRRIARDRQTIRGDQIVAVSTKGGWQWQCLPDEQSVYKKARLKSIVHDASAVGDSRICCRRHAEDIIGLILCFGHKQTSAAPVDRWATDPGFDRHQMCASRVNPTCRCARRRARGCDIWRTRTPCSSPRGGRNRRVHQTGRNLLSTTRFRTRFSARSDPPQYAACRQWSCRCRTSRTFHNRSVVLIRSIRWIRSAPSRIDPAWAPAWGQCRTERGYRLNLFPACQRSMGR